ncbi:uncharacterized protein [Amphiura filiformis]|uniref:uncharacterized protein n=1 Tax=Amphiura filiformis TaxID=82378 RepID=UPI003B211E6E
MGDSSAGVVDKVVRLRFSSRDDTRRDIQDWAKPARRSSDDEDQTTMIGGQLKDNVTEQRMLESRLFDLSRERYKFMVQVAWQRKAFLDKQKRKTGMMKDLLKGVDTSTVQPGKRNQSERLQEKIETYKGLVDTTYGDVSRKRKHEKAGVAPESDDSLEEKIPIFPKPIKTASFAKNKRVFQTEVQPQRHDKTRSFPLDKRKVVFPSIGAEDRNNRIPDHVDGRQSVPPNFMRRDVGIQRQNTDLTRPRTQIARHSISAGAMPRFLKYRASYDRRFSSLERLLTNPYDGHSSDRTRAVFSGVDDMSSLLKQLPPTTPVPTIETTPIPP